MSSLGGLIVLAVLTAASLAAMGYLIMAMVTHDQLFMERAKFMEKIGERCKGYLEIESKVKLQDNRTVEAVIKNVGAGSIPVKEFDEIDLIMIYRNSNGSIRAEWLPYDPSGNSERGWRALNVTYHGVEELKNPVAADMSSGFWDDEESLAIRAWISIDQEIADEFMLIMVAPNGVRTRRERNQFIKSLNGELDRRIGALRIPFLCLIEGPNDSGKSIISQQYTYGALNQGFSVLYITTETGAKALINSMEQITLNVKYFFLTGQFQVFELHVRNLEWDKELASKFLDMIIRTIKRLSRFDVYVIDSLTYLVTYAVENDILNFFTEARNIVDDLEKSIFITIHPYAFEQDMLIRMRSICDVHFILSIKEIGDKIVKLLQVPKLKGAVKPSSITLSFDVDPAFGIKVLPFSQAKA